MAWSRCWSDGVDQHHQFASGAGSWHRLPGFCMGKPFILPSQELHKQMQKKGEAQLKQKASLRKYNEHQLLYKHKGEILGVIEAARGHQAASLHGPWWLLSEFQEKRLSMICRWLCWLWPKTAASHLILCWLGPWCLLWWMVTKQSLFRRINGVTVFQKVKGHALQWRFTGCLMDLLRLRWGKCISVGSNKGSTEFCRSTAIRHRPKQCNGNREEQAEGSYCRMIQTWTKDSSP